MVRHQSRTLDYVLQNEDGCPLRPSCVRCSLPACVFDDERMLYWDAALQVYRATRAGISAEAATAKVRRSRGRAAAYVNLVLEYTQQPA